MLMLLVDFLYRCQVYTYDLEKVFSSMRNVGLQAERFLGGGVSFCCPFYIPTPFVSWVLSARGDVGGLLCVLGSGEGKQRRESKGSEAIQMSLEAGLGTVFRRHSLEVPLEFQRENTKCNDVPPACELEKKKRERGIQVRGDGYDYQTKE